MVKQSKMKSNFRNNVIILMTGSFFSQIILIIVSPLLTRLFTPDDFGSSSLFLSISSILLILTTARYEMAIVQTKKNIDAISLVLLTILLSFFSFIILNILYIIFNETEYIINLNNKLNGLLYFIPLYVFIANIYRIIINYMNRNRLYKIISLNQIIQSIFQSSSKVIFGLVDIASNGLILGTIIGQIIALLLLIYRFIGTKIKIVIYIVAIKRIKKNLYLYKDFPKYLLLSDGINVIALQLPYLMTSFLFSMKELGFLSLSYSMSSLPLSFLGSSLSRVFRQQASDDYNRTGRCDILFIKMLKKIIIYLTFPFILIFYSAPIVFKIVFGEQWIQAGEIVQILIFMFFFQFIARILTYMYILTNHQKENLILQILLLISTVISFLIGFIFFKDLYISLTLFGITYSIFYIYTIYKSYIYSKGNKNYFNNFQNGEKYHD